MKKYIKIIINIMSICILMCSFSTNVFAEVSIIGQTKLAADGSIGGFIGSADEFINQGASGDAINPDSLKEASDVLYNTLLAIGIGVAVIWGFILGIKFVTGGLDEKANVQKGLIIYVVGCVIIFGAFGIWKLVIELLQPLAQ